MHRQLKFIWPLLFATMSCALNTAVVKVSGTIVVFGVSKNKIVVAADSRGKDEAGEYADHQCKIITLSDKFIFASNGMAALRLDEISDPPQQRFQIMDVNKEARIAFEAIPPMSQDFLAKIAINWGENISQIFEREIKRWGPKMVLGEAAEGPIINGYFFGLSPTGGLSLYMENIYRSGNGISFDPQPKVTPLSDVVAWALQGRTELAQKERSEWDRRSISLPNSEDRDVLRAILWVQLTLDANPRNHEIGGPIDSLTVTPTGGIRWYHQKKECQEQH